MALWPFGVGAVVIGTVIFVKGKRTVDDAGDEDNYLLQYTVGPKARSPKAEKLFFGSSLLVIGGLMLLIDGVRWLVHQGG